MLEPRRPTASFSNHGEFTVSATSSRPALATKAVIQVHILPPQPTSCKRRSCCATPMPFMRGMWMSINTDLQHPGGTMTFTSLSSTMSTRFLVERVRAREWCFRRAWPLNAPPGE
jgi:hypothetical protein